MPSWTLFVCAAVISAASAAPVANDDPASVQIAPYAVVGCQMSENPHSGLVPSVYNITAADGCITTTYGFQSYVEAASSAALNGACSLSLYSGADCTGTVTAATLTSYEDCIPNNVNAQSLLLTCSS